MATAELKPLMTPDEIVEVPLVPGATVTELGEPQNENVAGIVVQADGSSGGCWNTNVWYTVSSKTPMLLLCAQPTVEEDSVAIRLTPEPLAVPTPWLSVHVIVLFESSPHVMLPIGTLTLKPLLTAV
jgi:hypothetical protein